MHSLAIDMKNNIKIWGMSYGLIGDLIAGLPLLTYFEKKYPNSYKYWVIEKKCSFIAPVFFNHPLIDRIKITDNWGGIGDKDRVEMSKCDILVPYGEGIKHSSPDWWNYYDLVEETALLHGITDLKKVLSSQEMFPKLYKWFDVGVDNPGCHTYTKSNNSYLRPFERSVALWPFGQGDQAYGRNPTVYWYRNLIEKLNHENIKVYHYGRKTEPALCDLPNYKKMTNLSFFDQLKACLASDVVLGPNTGPMWIIGAYNHPAIHLMTSYLPTHSKKPLSLAPYNINAINIYVEKKPSWMQCNKCRGCSKCHKAKR